MLDNITGEQLLEWEAFAALEPLGDERLDFLFAGLSSLIVNIARGVWGEKNTRMTTAEDFLPRWGLTEQPAPKKQQQSADEMKQILHSIYETARSKKRKGGRG